MFFREYCKIFKNTYFEKHWQTGASETHLINTKLFIQILLCTLEFRIDGTSRLLIIPFFCHPPQPYSSLPVYQFWIIPDFPFINSCAQSTSVAWSLGKATKRFDVHVLFYKHDVYKHIQAQIWWFFKHMLRIMLSLAKYYYVKHFWTSAWT